MIVIVGAGPAGMSAAHHLRDDFILIEKEREVGGLCRSFELAQATFDLGGHTFFTKHEYVRSLLERISPGGIYRQARSAWVWSHGTSVPYPFQAHLHGLPTEVIEDCLVGLIDAAAPRPDLPPVRDLAEWIHRSFGWGIAKHFLTAYNEKLWAFPLTELSPDWCSERIARPDVSAIVSGALRPRVFNDFPNAEVSYPARGGFQELYRGFLPRVAPRLRRSSVEQVNLARRRATLSDGEEIEYDWMISTMPLTELAAKAVDLPDEHRAAAARLRSNSLHLVNLVYDRPLQTTKQRVYVADPSVPFHKLVFNSNSSAYLREQPRCAVQAEVSWSEHKPVDAAGLVPRVHGWLRDTGLVEHTHELVASSVVSLTHAYPVYTRETRRVREHLLQFLEERRVLCAGRFGEWLYINSDDAVMRGRLRAERINTAA